MKAFTQCTKYRDPNHQHLDHDFRIRCRKKGLAGPEGITVWGDRKHIYGVRLHGKIKTRYIDVMVSGITPAIVPALIEALEIRYDRRGKVVGVFHADEAQPHVHMLVPWVDAQGRALRLKRGEWWRVGDLMASITGHVATPSGQGRRRITTQRWEIDPAGARRLATEMSEADRAVLQAIDRILGLYGGIGIYALRTGTPKQVLQQSLTSSADVHLRQLYLMVQHGYALCFALAPANARSSVLFVDDVPAGQLPCLPAGALVVRTPGNRYQAHVPFDRELDAAQRMRVQGWLAARYDAHAVTGGDERRYLPGFRDPEQAGAPAAVLVQARPALPALLYQDYRDDLRRHREITEALERALQQRRARGGGALLESVSRTWNDYYEGDAAAADFSYALYLLQQGLSDDEIVHMLITQSRDIVTRKRTTLMPYVRRVIARAKEWTFRQGRASGQAAADNPTRSSPTT